MGTFIRDNTTNLVASLIAIAVLVILRWIIVRAIVGKLESSHATFRLRKSSTYLTVGGAVVILAVIWAAELGSVGSFIGIMAAGLVIALSDLLKDLAGWMYIYTRRPFRAGDRIEIGGNAGDVIDIRPFRFSLLEIKGWVDADQSTGRIMHIPNGLLFSEPMANYTEGFPFVWHEMAIVVTFESDWKRAEEIILDTIEEHAPDPTEAGAVADLQRTAGQYFIQFRHLTPTVYVKADDSGVRLTARMLVQARTRRGVDSAVWRSLLDAFAAEPNVELAYPTVRHYRQGEDHE
jgi:small-conductance mechanosensitive channel